MTTKQQTADARESLRSTFPAGSTVHISIKHVSRSGMQRAIAVYATDEDGDISNVSWEVARAIGWNLHTRHDGVKVDGCGMDMGFHLVYTLSHLLHGDGYALKQRYI
jgi:hypothetical protein